MTEARCPACGIECEKIYTGKTEDGYFSYRPIPLGLTKLREAYKEHMELLTQEVMSDTDEGGRVDRVIQSAGKLLSAIKELLEEK